MNKLLDLSFAGAALVLLVAVGLAAPAMAAEPAAPAAPAAPAPVWDQQLRELTKSAEDGAPGQRVEIEVGQLDPRLKLAPCDEVQAYLPPGTRPWGKTRIGLRCIKGSAKWNVYLPVTVHVYASSLVAAQPLAAGAVLTEADLREAEVDIAAAASPALARPELAVGRTLARPLSAGDTLRQAHIKPRQWFAAGDTVTIVAVGAGYAVSGEGQALTHGVDGQSVRVKTESGRVVTGQAVADRRVEMAL